MQAGERDFSFRPNLCMYSSENMRSLRTGEKKRRGRHTYTLLYAYLRFRIVYKIFCRKIQQIVTLCTYVQVAKSDQLSRLSLMYILTSQVASNSTVAKTEGVRVCVERLMSRIH